MWEEKAMARQQLLLQKLSIALGHQPISSSSRSGFGGGLERPKSPRSQPCLTAVPAVCSYPLLQDPSRAGGSRSREAHPEIVEVSPSAPPREISRS